MQAVAEKKDFEPLPQRKNKGRYVGAVIGIRNSSKPMRVDSRFRFP
jgi:hypothetical protein